MRIDICLARIAAARQRNLAPWGCIRTLAGDVRPIQTGHDARLHDLRRAIKADPCETGRLLLQVAWGDLRVVWQTIWLAVRLRWLSR